MSGRPSLGLSLVRSSHHDDWPGPVDPCIDVRLRYAIDSYRDASNDSAKKIAKISDFRANPERLLVINVRLRTILSGLDGLWPPLS